MPKESSLWRLIRDHSPKGIHWQRIESGITASGIPDLNGCSQGTEVWIELKMVKGNQLGLRPMQRAWLFNRALAGGNCFVLAKKEKEIKIFRINVESRSAKTLAEIEELNWKSPAAFSTRIPFNWQEIFNVLMS